ncbi:MAG: antibiotic biosynthesis monooxygenase [Chloroflexi bacterium]|nr:antibiotic biosynthesis monooxygenase [Chloroflexota bacterium]
MDKRGNMVVFQFHHYIKPECIEAYKAAILEDARESIKEDGILAFEVFQDRNDPSHFSLLEIYRDSAAREFHLHQPYFLKFKDAYLGQEMAAEKGKGDEFDMLFPSEP